MFLGESSRLHGDSGDQECGLFTALSAMLDTKTALVTGRLPQHMSVSLPAKGSIVLKYEPDPT